MVQSLNYARGRFLPISKQGGTVNSYSLSHSHHPDMGVVGWCDGAG